MAEGIKFAFLLEGDIVKKLFAILIGLLFVAGLAATCNAEIYKWVDEKDTVHFTEDPATIPEKYKDKVKSRVVEEERAGQTSPMRRSPQKGSEDQRNRVEEIGGVPETEHKRFDEGKFRAFLGKYCTYQQDVYEAGSRTAVKHRKGEIINHLVSEFRDAFMMNPDFDEGSFREFVERYGTHQSDVYASRSKTSILHRKGDIIPERIPSLFRQFSGEYQRPERGTAEQQEKRKIVKPGPPKDDRDPQPGEFLPRSGTGVINPRTGEFYPPSGPSGYINLRTGEIYPKSGQGAIKP
jgi:hypothetical protein